MVVLVALLESENDPLLFVLEFLNVDCFYILLKKKVFPVYIASYNSIGLVNGFINWKVLFFL